MGVVTLRARLSDQELSGLMRSRPDADRAGAAAKICKTIGRSALTADDQKFAEQILSLLAEDAAIAVRKALSVTLQNSPHLPRAIARKLAEDIDDIAVPVLENSPILTDEDLIAVLRAGEAVKQYAIAGRDQLSEGVVDVLADVGTADALARAAANDDAAFTPKSLTRALGRFPRSTVLADAVVDRALVPDTVIETLVAAVSETALRRLARKHALPPSLAVELAEGARERATIDILDQAGCARDMERFVQQLVLNGRLTPSLIIRGVCMGHVRFFEHALAEMAGVPHSAAWMMVHDAGPLGLRAVFERAGLPMTLYPAARAAIDTYHEIELEGGPADRQRIVQRMIERVLTRRHVLPGDAVSYLLDKLDAVGGDFLEAEDPETPRMGVAAD